MTSPRITFTYSSSLTTDPWWVRLVQEDIPDDIATMSDAANLLDTLYGLDACDTSAEGADDVAAETFEQEIVTKVDQVACLFDADANVEVTIRVIRSTQEAEYRLALQGGRLETTETITEALTLEQTIEDSSDITLDYPVLGGFSASWRGRVYAKSGMIDPPVIRRTGNTLDFSGVDVASGNLTCTFVTTYDRCVVTILGVDGKAGACTARAFFHGLVDELGLEVPEALEPLESCTARWTAADTEYDITCYQEVTVSTRCQCTDKEVSSRTYDEVVTCPEAMVRCPGNTTTCRHLMGSVTVPEYVECSDDNEVTGRPGMIHSLSTPEYYEERCCKPPSFPLPDCPVKTITHRGAVPIKGGAAQYYALYGPKLRIIPVSPPGGICGNWTISQEVRSSDCCDGVEPMVWDTSISPDVMSPNSAITVGVTGGRPPYVWTVTGQGVQFQNGSKRIVTDSNRIYLAALPTACGWAGVTISDGCSTVEAGLRITSGEWQLVGNYFSKNEGVAFSAVDMLRPYCGTVLTSLVYLGAAFDGSVSEISADNRFWMGGGSDIFHTDPILPGQVGRPMRYTGILVTLGVPLGSGCLDGYATVDPFIGVFRPILAIGCYAYEGGVYSRTPAAEISIYQWGCVDG